MHLEWIETYLDLMETGNFKSTAENLNLTQSTVSHRVQILEDVLGCKLFDRGRSGAKPSPAGQQFFPYAQAIRFEWNNAKDHLQSTQTNAPLKMGIQFDLAKIYAGDFLEATRSLYPHSNISVEVDYSQQMIRDIERGDLDFGIIFSPDDRLDLWTIPIGTVRYHMIALEKFDVNALDKADYTFPNISPAFRSFHENLYPWLSQAKLQSGQSDAIAQFLRSLGGASYVIEGLAQKMQKDEGFQPVNHAETIEQTVYFSCHARRRNMHIIKKLTQSFQIILQKTPEM